MVVDFEMFRSSYVLALRPCHLEVSVDFAWACRRMIDCLWQLARGKVRTGWFRLLI
jgi:hypothetical protein